MLTALEVKRLRYQELRSQGTKNAGALLPNRIPDAQGLYISISPPSERAPGRGQVFPLGLSVSTAGARHLLRAVAHPHAREGPGSPPEFAAVAPTPVGARPFCGQWHQSQP